MADLRRVPLDELINRPGTYFNPLTEVLLIVDDSPHLDTELLETEGGDQEWVLVSDEVPIDEHERDALLERFQIRHTDGLGDTEDEDEEEEEELEPDELGPDA
jgi:hypothetical protein